MARGVVGVASASGAGRSGDLGVSFLLHQLLDDAARERPEHPAVRCEGDELTYAELAGAANGLARTLLDAGIRPADRVGIHLPKRVETLVAVYGVLKAGAAYVPLDPKAPAPRVAMVAQDCAISALVTTPGRATALLSLMDGPPPRLVVLADDGSEAGRLPSAVIDFDSASRPASDPEVPVIDADVAYILYTSGSTGVPKGVTLTHRNALTFVDWSAARIGVEPGDRLSNHAPLHFDLSVFDLFLAALGRATVVLVPEEIAFLGTELARFVRSERITIWYSVPTALTLLARTGREPGAFPDLRTVVFAGEVYPTRDLRTLRHVVPDAALWNLYGPTETNVCTYHRVDEIPEDDRTIPIGRACENTEVFAVDGCGCAGRSGRTGRAVRPRRDGDARLLGAAGQDRRGPRAQPAARARGGARLSNRGPRAAAAGRRLRLPGPAGPSDQEPRVPHRARGDRGRPARASRARRRRRDRRAARRLGHRHHGVRRCATAER